MTNRNKEILQTRAAELASGKDDFQPDSASLEIITFMLAGESYGIESEFVREVYSMKDFTQLPGLPAHIFGLINVRGRILTVVDIKSLFNLPSSGFGEFNKVIILHNEQMEFGILSDVVLGTAMISEDSIQNVPETITGIGEKYLKGVTKDHLIILNARVLLAGENLLAADYRVNSINA